LKRLRSNAVNCDCNITVQSTVLEVLWLQLGKSPNSVLPLRKSKMYASVVRDVVRNTL